MDQDLDDPYDWSTDQVVRYLCHNESTPWSLSKNPSPLPDRNSLEAALREHGITGEVLLDGSLEDFFRNALKLKEGPYYTVNRAIRYAQGRSPKYQTLKRQGNFQFAPMITPPLNSHWALDHTFSRPTTALFNSPGSPTEGEKLPDKQLLASLQAVQPSSSPRIVELDDVEQTHVVAKIDKEPVSNIQEDSPRLRTNETVHIDEHGRRRRRLDLTTIELKSPPVVESLAKVPNSESWYLGPTKVDPANIFYPIQADSSKDDWSFSSSHHPCGRRLFVKKKMHHFFRTQAVTLPSQKGTSCLAIFPYDEDAVNREKPRYYTLYTSHKGRTEVTMKSTADSAKEVQGITDQNLSNDPESSHDYLLKKYPVKEDEDSYPIYGESGSEGDYDSDTWREMDDEREQAAIRASKYLSTSQIDSVIDQCITKFKERWRIKRLPRLELEAHGIWLDARRNKSRNSSIKILLDSMESLKLRSKRLKEELHDHEWAQKSQLENQCESLEPTVFEFQTQKQRLSVLELSQCPPKPPLRPRSTKKMRRRIARTPPDEESLSSDSEDGSLEDFIEDDMEVDLRNDPNVSTALDSKVDIKPGLALNTPSISRNSSGSSSSNGLNSDEQIPEKTSPPGDSMGMHSGSEINAQPRCGFYYSSENESADDPLSSNPKETVQDQGDREIEVIDLTTTPQKSDSFSKRKSQSLDTNYVDLISDDVMVVVPSISSQKSRSSSIKPTPKSEGTTRNESRDRKKTPFSQVQREDAMEILGEMVKLLSNGYRSSMHNFLFARSEDQFKQLVKDGLKAISKNKTYLQGMSGEESDLVLRATVFYIAWVNRKYLSGAGIIKGDIRRALNKIEGFGFNSGNFAKYASDLRQLLEQYNADDITPSTGDSDDEEDPVHFSQMSSRKRKRHVKEDQAVKSGQVAAKQRVEIQEEQRKSLEQRLKRVGVSNSDPEHQAVSFEQPTIFLDPHIGRCVKPHQLSGIQFMWRELIQSEKRDGCLLAHTMGLGKTMQVISLLVTIAAAANSSDPAIRKQVPQFFHRSQTLILCPPSLIDNWYEEFLMWTPKEHALGPIRKIASVDSLDRKISTVESWDADGGILILSYNLFRSWVIPEQSKNKRPPVTQASEKLRDQLLKGPRIIVADEAHQMKNKASKLAQAAALLESKSRIALTGSPLANNLIDYYAMINWISPNYLDEIAVFRDKYLVPIEEGLFSDSSYSEQRKSLKKLQVLKEILAPKIHRADISVLEGSLPMKVEFVITVPLTEVQKKAYNRYVAALLGGNTGSSISSATFLSWLALLALCCNHPACFYNKLAKRAEEKAPKNANEDLIDQETYPIDVPLSSLGFNEAMWASQKEFLSEIPDLNYPKHSHRANIFKRIVEESVRVGDKILCFSHSIPTLDYLETLLRDSGVKFDRLDGSTAVRVRQEAIKQFNNGEDIKVYLISTRAGGLGLNITGANRVIIFDFGFNPTWEEQAVGRAYRLGQKKPVYIYRFLAGGTFEDIIHNKSIFKTQLAMRVVDKKNVERSASRSLGDYLYPVKDVKQQDISEYIGRDRDVLDKILLQNDPSSSGILKIALTETFRRENDEMLTEDEKREMERELELERLRTSDPVAYRKRLSYPSTSLGSVNYSSSSIHTPNSASSTPTQNNRAIFKPPPWAGVPIASSQANINSIDQGPASLRPENATTTLTNNGDSSESAAQTSFKSLSISNAIIDQTTQLLSSNPDTTEQTASGLLGPVSMESLTTGLTTN